MPEGAGLSERLSIALIAALAGALTGGMFWYLFAVGLGRYLLSVDHLHFIDALTWCAAIPAIGGLLAPDRTVRTFGAIRRWTCEFIRLGGGMPPP